MSVTYNKKKKRNVVVGVVHIHATYNNIIVTITDQQGHSLVSTSAGAYGFKGSKKATPYAAQETAGHAVKTVVEQNGMKTVSIKVSGPGAGREAAIRAVQACNLNVTSIKDTTKLPHNGCKLPGRRRV
ncbi:30S ribosomal protein S11 [Ehrlichia ruminantium]|uniref:Small ribosomal subunit protein uS11 n=3 Tax=Ehrlichia ruminantium TaxID=779 RepID=RS11_EHRRG|nr:30S ribosomal protein S11 [Ehrlichia ruminantium]Q5FFS0.1 RecName: Full=Small ribosomal subunit protein uS11; AltName: Full=30S ribosomal protein S11 [Ehrlichia ruminantium str. Gardel]Q5HAU4.1 RecName: Full=Small ribosomal subunit protein uS11; AltName: Full=30S ribosomal protein S11 [Ehrlichia ruminantium str. Welgevonden]KYW91398.1 30S ribosomal protein S11 [Ehrlichia ruminantium]QLK50665.1 30S ribosomal protein S11 [Ehrlichia ruminantium]QLK51590.1 30S ribosomal protein S11 [Ehrlichia r